MEYIEIVISGIGLVVAVVGSILALIQWNKSNDYKRAEFVRDLIGKVRDDEDISAVMAMVDWDEGLVYTGKFHISDKYLDSPFYGMPENELFSKIDKTLSHFSYICYLNQRKCLAEQDMYGFEYEIKAIINNKHMMNYLYSIFHFSKRRGVNTSFIYLIDYCIKRGWINRTEFLDCSNEGKYHCYL